MILSSDAPGLYGSALAIAIGVAMFGLGVYLFFTGAATMPLKVSLLILGASGGLLGFLAMNRNRVAWSFALSLNGTLGVVFLFGAPKVRDAADISLGLAIAPAFILGLATTLMALSSKDYEA